MEKFKDLREQINKENEAHKEYTLDDLFGEPLEKIDELLQEIHEMSEKYAKK